MGGIRFNIVGKLGRTYIKIQVLVIIDIKKDAGNTPASFK